MTHIWIQKDVGNERGIGGRYDVVAGGRDVVGSGREQGDSRDTASDFAIDSRRGEFPTGIRISITEALRNLPGIVNVGQAPKLRMKIQYA